MNSQFSDIRKEYKKGKLTRNTISENPFEQFARWLNDALHCGENEPTAMIVATVSPDGRLILLPVGIQIAGDLRVFLGR